MRVAEWSNLVFFLFFSILAWLRPLPPEKRLRATLFGAVGLALTSALLLTEMAAGRWAMLVRDWLPAPMMLVAYWQAGQFFVAPNPRLQGWLESVDERWLGRAFPLFARQTAAGAYLEFAYLFCYPMVPAALGCLYWAGMGGMAGEFWAVVVPAGYICYGMVPFFQTLPPRKREEEQRFGAEPGGLRRLNLSILHRASIQANTFPSAHVAASLAAALVVLRYWPAAGAVLLWISLSIAAGAVLRRYHYALDVLAGAAVAVAVFFVTLRLAG